MTKLYGSIKFFFKSLKSTFLINLAYFLIFPLALAFFFGMIEQKIYENPIKVDPVPITLIDKDNSTYSRYFKDYIKNDLGEILTLEKDIDDAKLQITIPNGYEKHILDKTQTNIEIKELDDSNYTESVQNIFDNYHKTIYLSSIKGEVNSKNLTEILSKSSINTKLVDSNIKQNSYEYFAITILGFLAMLFIVNTTSSNYIAESNGLAKRTYSLPLSKTELLIHDIVTSTIYSFIFIFLYALFFRVLNITFKGDLIILIVITLAISLLTSSFSTLLYTFFSKSIGQIIAYILLIGQILCGVIFSSFLDTAINFNPCYIVTEMFTNYNVYNNFASIINYLYLCLGISFILIIVTLLKVNYSRREF